MHVDIHERRVHPNVQRSHREAVDRQKGMIPLQQRLIQREVAHIPTIDNGRDAAAIRARHFGLGDEARDRIIQAFHLEWKHLFGNRGAIDACNNLKQIPVS
ncbi:hypothetical protein D3C85_1534590 [compost metagenome]